MSDNNILRYDSPISNITSISYHMTERMIYTKQKAEIQALASRGIKFFTEEYLPNKIENGDWV